MSNNEKTFFEKEIEKQINMLKPRDPIDKNEKINHVRGLMEKYDHYRMRVVVYMVSPVLS